MCKLFEIISPSFDAFRSVKNSSTLTTLCFTLFPSKLMTFKFNIKWPAQRCKRLMAAVEQRPSNTDSLASHQVGVHINQRIDYWPHKFHFLLLLLFFKYVVYLLDIGWFKSWYSLFHPSPGIGAHMTQHDNCRSYGPHFISEFLLLDLVMYSVGPGTA